MTFIANHQWIIPLAATLLWIGLCWWLGNVLTGGMAMQVTGLILVVGVTVIWLVYGAWRWIMYLLGIWTLRG